MLKSNFIIASFLLLTVLITFSACNYAADIIDIEYERNEPAITDDYPEEGEPPIPSWLFESEAVPLDFTVHITRYPDHTGRNLIRGYPAHFFEHNYLVTFNLQQPNHSLDYRVVGVLSDGTIILQRAFVDRDSLAMVSNWQIIIELDNSTMPDEFNLVFYPPVDRWREDITIQTIVSPDCLPPLIHHRAADENTPEEDLTSGMVFESAYWCECRWCDGSVWSVLLTLSDLFAGEATPLFAAHVVSGEGLHPGSNGWNLIKRYPAHFFEHNYFVTFNLRQPTNALEYRVARVRPDGTIVLRPAFDDAFAGGLVRANIISRWQIVIELDNSFMPDEFRVVFDPPVGWSRRWFAEDITVQTIVSPDCLPPLVQ